jgi:hypothetical protein
LIGGSAVRADSSNETIRQKHTRLLIIRLFDYAPANQTSFVESRIDFFDQLPVLVGVSGVEVVERYPEKRQIAMVFFSTSFN